MSAFDESPALNENGEIIEYLEFYNCKRKGYRFSPNDRYHIPVSSVHTIHFHEVTLVPY